MARCQQRSRNRTKRGAALARHARKEHVRERNACHRATTEIIRQHGLIAVEKLRTKDMTRSAKGTAAEPGSQVKAKAGLNREVLAQNWSLLRSQLRETCYSEIGIIRTVSIGSKNWPIWCPGSSKHPAELMRTLPMSCF